MAGRDNLNLLVKRFPSMPPEGYDDIIKRILQLIYKWTNVFVMGEHEGKAENVAAKEMSKEFKNIRAMDRLLQSKGYNLETSSTNQESQSIIAVPKSQLSSLRGSEELAIERKEFQEAKLRDLIRKGGPSDLAKANDLMKIISGYESRNETIIRDTISSELKWIEENLNRIYSSIKVCSCLQDLYGVNDIENSIEFCKVIQVKIKNILEREENEEYINFLLKINENSLKIIQLYESISAVDKNYVKLIDFSDIDLPESSLNSLSYKNSENPHFDIECKYSVLNNQVNLFFTFSIKNKMSQLENFLFQLASTKQATLEMGNLSSSTMNPTITQHTILFCNICSDPHKIVLKYKIAYEYFGIANSTEGLIKLSDFI